MTDLQLKRVIWNKANEIAKREYEEEYGEGSWDNADKYEREDYFWAAHEKLTKLNNAKLNNTNKKENKTMTKRNERMETLANAGINTGKYFSVTLPEGLAPGSSIQLVINENGQPVVVPVNENGIIQEPDYAYKGTIHKPYEVEYDPILDQIFESGYVKNTKLHRRWVMAQMFRMLNYKVPSRSYYDYSRGRTVYTSAQEGFNDYLNNRFDYKYQFTMMLEEVGVLSKLEKKDFDSFYERSHFFTKKVIIATCEDYLKKLKDHVNKSKTKKCKGVPYKIVGGRDVFIDDLNSKVFWPIERRIRNMKKFENYGNLYSELKIFIFLMVKLPYDTPKCAEWKDAFKGAGAYYTMKNLIMFHRCQIGETIKIDRNTSRTTFLTRTESMKVLERKLEEYKGEGWRMFAMMKKLIKDNEFDFNKAMKEIYSNK